MTTKKILLQLDPLLVQKYNKSKFTQMWVATYQNFPGSSLT